MINEFFVGDFRVRTNNFLNSRDGTEFEGNFEEMGEEGVERGVEFEFLATKIVKVGRKFFFEVLFDGLSDTKMTFGGGKDEGVRFFVRRKERHMG